MEEAIRYSSSRRKQQQQQQQPVICAATVILLGLIAFSCCIAAEFRRVKDKDIRVDGSLCSMPRRPAFALGLTALACLSLAQIVGTCSSSTSLSSGAGNKNNNNVKTKTMTNSMPRNQAVSITLLVLSWMSFGVAAILLGTASSMNNRQPYGRGWMDGEYCYVVKDGIFVGAALLVALTILLITTFIFMTRREIRPPRTGPDEERSAVVVAVVVDKQQLPPPTYTAPSCDRPIDR